MKEAKPSEQLAKADQEVPPQTERTTAVENAQPSSGHAKIAENANEQNQKEENAPRSIKSIKTSSLRKKVEKIETTVQQQESAPVLNQPFTAEALVLSWNRFTEIMNNDLHLKNAMKSCLPVLKQDYQFEVVVQNPVLEKKLQEITRKIETYLQHNLKNSRIKMSIRLAENGENVRPFTAKDRLEAMIKKNPNLDLLYRTFGLDLK